MTTKLEEMTAAINAARAAGIEPEIEIVYNVGSTSTTTPPPPPPVVTEPVRSITFKDTGNNLVPTYDLPDVNSTKCLVWDENGAEESCPPAGHKGMPKEADLVQREAHMRNIFQEWAWLDRQVLQKASLKSYSFPDVGASGQDLTSYPGMWVLRSALTTTTSQAWIDSLVAYMKTQWT